MRGIPQALFLSLLKALTDCDEFHSPRQLYAVLGVEELRPFQTGLPSADNLRERVDVTIGYLADKRRTSGENALVLLLRVLSGKYYEEDERRGRLAALADQLEWLETLPSKPEAAVLEANPEKAQMLWISDAEKMLACARAVARIDVPRVVSGQRYSGGSGTAWLVAPGLALTCWHVIEVRNHSLDSAPSADELQAQIDNALVTFDYTVSGKGLQYDIAALERPSLDSHPLDYALLRLQDRTDVPPLRERGYLKLDAEAPFTTETSLYIIQHPLGHPQQVAGGAFGKLSSISNRILYKTPTEPGTSGAPVLNRVNWSVVALHNGESKESLREGTLIKAILADLKQKRSGLYDEIMVAQSAKE